MASGRELNSFSGRQAEYGVTSIAFSPDGRALAATLGGLVKILGSCGWGVNCALSAALVSKRGRSHSVRKMDVGLPRGHPDTTIRLKDVVSGRDLGMIADHGRSDSLSAIAFSADGHTLASTNDDYTVRLWDIKSLRPYCERFPCNESLRELEGHTDHIYSIAFSPARKHLGLG